MINTCSRMACREPLIGQHIAIWNDYSIDQPRLYCMSCGMKIIRFNEQDALKLKHELRQEP